jgi:hypothetical protein
MFESGGDRPVRKTIFLPSTIVFIAAFVLCLWPPQLRSEGQENSQVVPAARDEALVVQKLPLLCSLTRPFPPVYRLFLDYATCVLRPQWIKTEDDLLSLFPRKNELMKLLVDLCNKDSGGINGPNRGDPSWPAIEKELGVLGIRAVISEDYVAGFSDGPFLEDLIARTASESCRLFIQMKNVRTESFNGEYIFMDLGADMKMVEIGEQFLRSFADSKFMNQMKDMLYEALVPLTDVHEASSLYIVGDLSREVYPGWTDIANHRSFIEKYPRSRFHDVVARIIDSMSSIAAKGPIYAVVTDNCASEEEARQLVLSYLLRGIDIPHILKTPEKALERCVAYRFFSDKGKAGQALKEIQKIKPQALIRIY